MGQPQRVVFPSNGIKIAGDLYLPSPHDPDRRKSAVVISHPFTGVKEQTAGLYAQKLAEMGFVALAFDAAYQGESEGEPRGLESPQQRAEDVRCAVTYLTTLEGVVDPERVGVLGICASGGYVPFAAQTDTRMKAVATISAADLGTMLRDGMKPHILARADLIKQLDVAGAARTAEAKSGEARVDQFLSPGPVEGESALVREGRGYYIYTTPRGQHPNFMGSWVGRSIDLLANFDAFAYNDLISPRPLLMIVATEADTAYFSRDAIEKALEPKELFEIEGKTHVGLYDDLSETLPKLMEFYSENLAA